METPTHKTCTQCGQTKPMAEFYEQAGGKYGREAACRDCKTQTRSITPNRVVRNRARHRAVAALIDRHRDEFAQLMAAELTTAQAEHEELTAAAAERGQDDAAVARLRPGPKRREQTSGVERLDVARCPHCIKHHDRGHVCAKCGSAPAAALRLPDDGDFDEIAIERAMNGDAVRLTASERLEVVRRLVEQGRSDADIARRLHVDSRSVLRWRNEHRIESQWSA